jgi:aminopeptidase N
LISAGREGDTLILSQRRFTYLPNDSSQTWLIPVNLRVFSAQGQSRQREVLMEAAELRVDLGQDAAAYKLNDGQTGYYRVKYADASNLQRLGALVRQKVLPPEDRWGIQNDRYALVVAGEAGLDEYLAFLEHYRDEDDYLPLAGITANLGHMHLAAGPGTAARIAGLAGPWLGKVLGRIGHDPGEGENQTTAILRDQVLFEAVRYGCPQAEAFALKRFENLRQSGTVHPDILRSILQSGAWHGDGRVFDWMDRRFQSSPSEHERLTLLAALGCFRGRTEIEKVLDYVLTSVPARNAFIPLVALAANRHATSLLWDWYVSRLSRIEQFHPMLYERVVAAVLPSAGLERPEEVTAFFTDYMRKNDKAVEVIRLSLERLEINLRLRAGNP